MLSKFIKQSWLVIVAALVFGLMVAVVDGMLRGKIEQNAKDKLEREMKVLLGPDSVFEEETGKDEQGDDVVYYVAKGPAEGVVGYAFEAKGSGFADKITFLVAVDAKMEKLSGIAVLKTNETPGFGDKMKDDSFKGQFVGCPCPKKSGKLVVKKTGDAAKVDSEIVSITGATVTSEAVAKIVNDGVIRMAEIIGEREKVKGKR